ncbi:hypothetical protein MBRA1_000634 [Malassezia brasiliensis]|uniref:F-box domain-containing protein n=1 Tax=Malassezia brasiliensis TaxID=1821822 RepID=A0AAF0IMH9_9BASI|nr:hypothetical protein MBRA1_000634 [Malassezia brasiliensis]
MSVLKEVAMDAVARDAHPRKRAARLAQTCRAWFVVLYGRVLLPDLVLRGAHSLRHFGFSLTRNTLGLGALVARHTRTLTVLQGPDDAAPEALFDGVARTRRFGLDTIEVLRMVLRRCTALRALRLQCEPLALDLRDGAGGLFAARAALEEVVCLQSPWAGDAIDTIWRPGTPYAPWRALTHLQLHGPRSRISVRTVDALAELPQLTHLALVMPSFTGPHGARSATQVLSVLADRLPRLACLLVVGHDEEQWVGATRHLRPALEQLVVHDTARALDVTLVTARVPGEGESRRTHPGQYSDWMLRRALQHAHWHFAQDDDEMHYVVETWRVPYVPPAAPPVPFSYVHDDGEARMDDMHVDDDELWFDAQEAGALRADTASPEIWGIDNLA